MIMISMNQSRKSRSNRKRSKSILLRVWTYLYWGIDYILVFSVRRREKCTVHGIATIDLFVPFLESLPDQTIVSSFCRVPDRASSSENFSSLSIPFVFFSFYFFITISNLRHHLSGCQYLASDDAVKRPTNLYYNTTAHRQCVR
jgi:hypothetical protein